VEYRFSLGLPNPWGVVDLVLLDPMDPLRFSIWGVPSAMGVRVYPVPQLIDGVHTS
jgi:hypothetical protein